VKTFTWLVVAAALLSAGLYGWAYSGAYDIGADTPHWKLTAAALAMVRDKSIEARSASLQVPDLGDQQLVAMGAQHYEEMCADCHRAPGAAESEIRQGLYPQPPDLTRAPAEPAESFWVIKHGIKMSGMPAWGRTHDDQKIWAIVAFLQKLPALDQAAYAALAGGGHDDHDGETGHEHDMEHLHGHDHGDNH
jgi:mono/diheme cytochrome c family protein